MTAALDRRVNAFRPDLAAEALRGRVKAPRFATGERRRVAAGHAPLRREPRPDAPLDTELLHGEALTVYEERGGWAWAQAQADSYVGYVPAEALGETAAAPTHRVAALRAHVYPAPDIKTPPLYALSLNALLVVADEAEGRFLGLAEGGFVHAAHVARVDAFAGDFVAVAEGFLGTPYLWGGRTGLGVDCSGLVQQALQAAGIACPRDSDMQETALGEPLGDASDLSGLRRGDLVFWRGHAGIMIDPERLLHANAFHMRTVIEPVAETAARIARTDGPVTSIRRLGEGAQA